MKYLKMLGLAAVAAMALMAFLGASSASATVLCKTTITEGCATSGWDYPKETPIVLSADGSLTLRNTEGSLQNTCTESTIEGKTENTGSSTETVKGIAERSVWGKCTEEPTTTIKNGTIEIHHLVDNPNTPSVEMGTITASGWEVTTKVAGVSCVFKTGEGLDLGELTDVSETGNGTATADIHAIVTKTGGFLCPTTAIWEGHYWVTTPKPLYVSTS